MSECSECPMQPSVGFMEGMQHPFIFPSIRRASVIDSDRQFAIYLLDWPQNSFRFFCKVLPKENRNEFFSQPNT